jgi:hypothetical protein
MKDELLAQLEREVLGWDGVFRKRNEDGPGGVGVTGYRYGDPETGGPQIGHLHDDGHADFSFPREVREELISSGQAISHLAFPNSRTTASYRIRSTKDVPKVLEFFRVDYERLKEPAEWKAERRKDEAGRRRRSDRFG